MKISNQPITHKSTNSNVADVNYEHAKNLILNTVDMLCTVLTPENSEFSPVFYFGHIINQEISQLKALNQRLHFQVVGGNCPLMLQSCIEGFLTDKHPNAFLRQLVGGDVNAIMLIGLEPLKDGQSSEQKFLTCALYTTTFQLRWVCPMIFSEDGRLDMSSASMRYESKFNPVQFVRAY